ncbi:hypothetical protein CTEN210_00530 [Chaetoceros tenuissimus]|uniref:BRO1 domain-containing protein n=1 Tax=Chaetoceros tenuissimus TaxID=426638 RepID=A0AAD3GYS9_9STRA|nr:hypothetical protein CTEN210_00530 [Chaetoceros tenuissimus]
MILTLPLKATKRIDLIKPLSTWVETSHPQFKADQVTEQIKRLNSIRVDIAKACTSPTSHAFTLKNNVLADLMEYHACLIECINYGFPSGSRDAEVNGTLDAHLSFYWKNAFVEYDGNDEGQCSQRGTSHFDFERASVLWNIAALYSYQAAKEDWTSKEGRINAKTHYTLAAKIIRHIQDMLKSEKDPDLIPDMYTSCLTMCHEMLLMQGQIAAYEALKVKLAEPGATTSTFTLLTKISSGVALHADKALEASQDLQIKEYKSTDAWGGHFKVLSMLYKARAEFLQSQVERRENNVGLEIARLERTIQMAVDGKEFMKSVGFVKMTEGPDCLGKIDTNLQAIVVNAKQRFKILVNENNSIYHEKVPDSKKLPKIQPKDLMEFNEKDISLPVEFTQLKRPLFS